MPYRLVIAGTIAYMAPESFIRNHTLGVGVDIYGGVWGFDGGHGALPFLAIVKSGCIILGCYVMMFCL